MKTSGVCGIGCDIAKVSRFSRWVENDRILTRFFNREELYSGSGSMQRKCEYYAVRFAAKEAFSKALGTGLAGFSLADIYIVKDSSGSPSLVVTGQAAEVLKQKCGENAKVLVSLSHEKEYAVAFVIIEAGVAC